jgi:hypothetical protein
MDRGSAAMVRVHVGWLLFTIVMLGVAAVALLWPKPPAGIDPAKVRHVCEQYAGLDLSGMVQICKEAGYQEVMREDLGR